MYFTFHHSLSRLPRLLIIITRVEWLVTCQVDMEGYIRFDTIILHMNL